MHSHYAQEATSYANMQLSVHERIDDLWRRAHGLAPSVAESAAGSGCTDKAGTYRAAHKALGPRQRMAWDMIAEAHGWNAISDSPAMLAEAERRESAGEPYYVGYENTKPAEFTTALATETNVFEFGVWGHDQPLELLPADDARETAEVNALVDELSAKYGLSTEPAELHYHDELRHYSDGDSIAVIPCTERHESANPAQPQSCGCWNATHLGSCIHQPADPWSAADLAASNAAQPQRAPWAVAEDFPQRASYVPAQPADCRCSVSWGSCPAHSHAAQPATPERAVVTLTLSDQAAGCPVHGAGPCRCDDLLSEEEPAAAMPLVGLDTPEAKSAMRAQVDAGTYTADYDAGYAVGESGARPAVGPHERSYAWHRGYADALLDAEQSQTDTELADCENCSAPCDGTLTAHSELFGEDMPVCVTCHGLLTLTSGDPAYGLNFRFGYSLAQDDLKAGQRGQRELNDTPAGVHDGYARAWAEATESGARHAGELWDIPTSYAGRHRCSVI